MFLNYLQEKKRKKAGPGSSRLENQKVCKCAQEDYKAELGYPLKKSYGNNFVKNILSDKFRIYF